MKFKPSLKAGFRIRMHPVFFANPDPDFQTRIRPFFALINSYENWYKSLN